MSVQESLFADHSNRDAPASSDEFIDYLTQFTWKQRHTSVGAYTCGATGTKVPTFTNEFWTSRQRAASSLHEVSYRACFKPQLPRFFITALSGPGDYVYDPFAGRGTTLIEAALLGRAVAGSDVNPLSKSLILPRLNPPTATEVGERLWRLDLRHRDSLPEQLLAFFHPETLAEICALREYLLTQASHRTSDRIDDWIRMVAVNRLTGHSSGFLSVYTLPPNQAVSVEAQLKINAERNQTPPRRDVRSVILRKTVALLSDVDGAKRRLLDAAAETIRFQIGSCTQTPWDAASFQLIVTSPPFLDVVDYATDNWLRCWFCGVEASEVPIEIHKDVAAWGAFVERAFVEFERLLKPGGFVAFEVGEVRRGTLQLEEVVLPRGTTAGLTPVCVVVNDQRFTKTANIWGVANNAKGTNTNRIALFQKAHRS